MSAIASSPRDGAARPEGAPLPLSRPSPGVIAALFCGYLAVGLPLPVLPLFIHERLGFSNFVVGLVIGIQFLATVLTRGYAGRITDQQGGRRSALQGAIGCALAGVLYLVAALPGWSAGVALSIVVIGRLMAGFGESQFVTGCVSWSIASVGATRAGLSMSWTGIAMFAALSIGAPVGMTLYREMGLQAVMLACIAAPAAAWMLAIGTAGYRSPVGVRIPFHRVVGQIWRQGVGLTLQGVGLAGLTAFASLFFASRGWTHAGVVMTCFGVGFIAVRVVFGHLPDKIGGNTVALWSLAVEAIGQALVWGARMKASRWPVRSSPVSAVRSSIPHSAWKRSSASRRPTAVAQSEPSPRSLTSLMASPVQRPAWWRVTSDTPPSTCWVLQAPCSARR